MGILSQTAEYALRAATYLAANAENGHVMAKDIAVAAKIPEKYLQKILRDLVHIGVLKSTRGCGGGFVLAKPPKRIKLSQVVSPFEQLCEQTHCPFGHPQHGKPTYCPIHYKWQGVVQAYTDFLEKTTLADLVEEREEE